MEETFEHLLNCAHELANAASGITLSHFRSVASADHKGGASFDPVTIADREAEAAMRAIIAQHYPSHGVLGEEFGELNSDADYVWILDPIDGTRAFILGMPLWGTLIGLTHKGIPILGIMDQPFTAERFWNDQKSTWYRGPRGGLKRCTSRKAISLQNAFLTASAPDMFEGENNVRFNRLSNAVRMVRFGGDCYAYCMVALGQIDIVAEAKLKSYDIVPLIPILEKAGAVVQSWHGTPAIAGGQCVACGDPALLPQVLSLLS